MSVYSMASYKHNFGQTITTDADGVSCDMGFIANLAWTALETAAADTDGVFDGIVAETTGGDPVVATPESDEFVAQPPCARNVTVTVAATTAGHVKAAAIVVAGTNLNDDTITESFTPTVDTPATLVGRLSAHIQLGTEHLN